MGDPNIAALVAVCWLTMWLRDRRLPMTAQYAGVNAACWAGLAVAAMARHLDLTMSMYAGGAAWLAWVAWTRRKPPRRRRSRVGAVVRNLGHRLAVSPA